MVSASLALRSLVWTILLPGIVAGYVPWFVVGYEEPTLRSQFGDSYDDYAAHVGRWIPTRPRARA